VLINQADPDMQQAAARPKSALFRLGAPETTNVNFLSRPLPKKNAARRRLLSGPSIRKWGVYSLRRDVGSRMRRRTHARNRDPIAA